MQSRCEVGGSKGVLGPGLSSPPTLSRHMGDLQEPLAPCAGVRHPRLAPLEKQKEGARWAPRPAGGCPVLPVGEAGGLQVRREGCELL